MGRRNLLVQICHKCFLVLLTFGALFTALSKVFPPQEKLISTQEEHDQLEQKIWRYIEVRQYVLVKLILFVPGI